MKELDDFADALSRLFFSRHFRQNVELGNVSSWFRHDTWFKFWHEYIHVVNVNECLGHPPGTLKMERIRDNEQGGILIDLTYRPEGWAFSFFDEAGHKIEVANCYKVAEYPPEKPGWIDYVRPVGLFMPANRMTIPSKWFEWSADEPVLVSPNS